MKSDSKSNSEVKPSIFVNTYTDGILDPDATMLGPLNDGGVIEAETAPGCWGPMITPHLKGGHEVTKPVFIENAEPGDAILIKIKKIEISSIATASGHDSFVEGHYLGDPYIVKQCPSCNISNPKTEQVGIGANSIQCVKCGNPVTPFKMEHGYTVVFDENKEIGITLGGSQAQKIALNWSQYAKMPASSIQHSILVLAPHDLVGVVSRLRPFLGQLGTVPAIKMPDSHNAGDFGSFLVGADHEFSLTEKELELRTDGHMDIDIVREGAIVLAPVKVKGGGVYLGDMHALQGDGEIAGHTMDVAGKVELEVKVIKGLSIDGPIIFPNEEDLPYLAKPLTIAEKKKASELAKEWGMSSFEKTAPVSIVGTGANLNSATENGLLRAANLFNMEVAEVRNRATINGSIEIGRHPGVVQVTFLAPIEKFKKIGLWETVNEQYNL